MVCKECGDNVVLRGDSGRCLRCQLDQLTRLRGLPQPTTAEAGTKEKVAVMAERYARGEQIFHPDDPRTERVNRRAVLHRSRNLARWLAGHASVKEEGESGQENALRNWEDGEGR